MNRKILTSGISIITALFLVGAGAYAYFSDVANSADNTFKSGTFDLQVSDDNENFQDSVSLSFVTPNDWAPGEQYTNFICFKNNGSVDIQQILLNLNTSDVSLPALAGSIYVSSIEEGFVPDTSYCNVAGTVGSDGLFDFTTEFESRFGPNTPLSTLITEIDGTNQFDDDLLDGAINKLEPGQIMKLRITYEFDPLATEAVAGQTVDLDTVYTAKQEEI